MKHSHYFKTVPTKTIDVYRVLEAFEVADPCIQHALKKLLVAGGRGAKNKTRDVQEAIDSLQRWQQMREEDGVGLAEAIAEIDARQGRALPPPEPHCWAYRREIRRDADYRPPTGSTIHEIA